MKKETKVEMIKMIAAIIFAIIVILLVNYLEKRGQLEDKNFCKKQCEKVGYTFYKVRNEGSFADTTCLCWNKSNDVVNLG